MVKRLLLGVVAGVVALVVLNTLAPSKVAGQTSKTVSSPALVTTAEETLAKSNNKTILQLDVPAARTVFIIGEINNTNDVVAQIYALNKKDSKAPIYIVLDSPGGSVLEGGKVIAAIEGVSAPVNTICSELCASMAAMIHSYGAKRYITGNSMLMYHDYSGQFQGEGAHMHSLMHAIERYMKRMNAHIAERSGKSLQELEIGELRQIWVDSEDATAQGFNDAIVSIDINALLPQAPAEREKLKQALINANNEYADLKELR